MNSEFNNPINKVIKKAWTDVHFRERLKREPREVLREFGVEIKEESIHVHINTPETKHLVLPEVPVDGKLTDADMERLVRAGATCQASLGFFGTCL